MKKLKSTKILQEKWEDVGCEYKGCSTHSGSNGINTTEIKQQPENHRGGHSCRTDPETCIVGVGKNS